MHIVFFREEKDGPGAKSKSRKLHESNLKLQCTFLSIASMFDSLEGFSETESWHSKKI